MFANGFRRQRTGSGFAGLLLVILLRLIIWPIFALMLIGPVAGCGFLGWTVIAQHLPQRLPALLAGISVLWQFISVNGLSIAATVPSFDPSSLLRFPLPFGRYLFLRTLLGLLTPSTIVGCLGLLAAAIGIGIADHSLALTALVVLAVYAAMNVFFTRMLAAWLERWLAARRFREIFSALMVLSFVGIQLLNSRLVASGWFLQVLNGSNPFLRWLPPAFAANSILLTTPLARLTQFAALLACTALFLAIFAIRLHKQFLGEYLSEGQARSTPAPAVPRPKRLTQLPGAIPLPAAEQPSLTVFSPILTACLRKEWFYLRGNGGGQLVAMLTPLIVVFILSRGVFDRHPRYFLPGAIAYVLIGVLPALYNIFGADAAGVQLYLLAPIRLRDVVLSKNIVSVLLILVQATLAWSLVLILATGPIPMATQVSAALWLLFVIAANITLGTLRSIQAPRKFVPGQTRQMRTPTNRTSGLLVIALFFASLLLQIPVALLSRHFNQPWLATMIFAPLAAGALITYALLVRNAEQLILTHREIFAEELCKA